VQVIWSKDNTVLQVLETYARTREWLPSCVRMNGWAHRSLGGREECTGVSTTPDLWPVGKQHQGTALTGSSLRRHATSPGGRRKHERYGGRLLWGERHNLPSGGWQARFYATYFSVVELLAASEFCDSYFCPGVLPSPQGQRGNLPQARNPLRTRQWRTFSSMPLAQGNTLAGYVRRKMAKGNPL
jgi:hypothetical protein